MRLWASDQVRNPNQHREEPEHQRHETCCKLCPSIDENGQRRQSKRDRREYGPKHLVGRNPLWNKVSRITKKECLPQSKGNGADAESQACHSAERDRFCCTGLRRG